MDMKFLYGFSLVFSNHFIESRVPGFPRDLCLAFGSLVWIWKQVGFHIWVWICSIFGNLKAGRWLISMTADR